MRLFPLLVLGAILAATPGCRQQSVAPPESSRERQAPRERVVGTRGGSLSYRVISPPKTFNYLMAADVDSLVVAFLLMGGRLAELNHDEQRYVPGVAAGWRPLGDGRTLEVTIREGVRFSDGHPLTADDVLFTFRAIYDERTASPIFRDAMMIGDRQIEVTVIDPHRLQLIFPETIAAPENYLSNIAVLPRHVLEEQFNGGTVRDAYAVTSDPRGIVTAGAFAVESVAPGERVVLRRNPFYWKRDAAGNPLPYLDTLVVEVVSDANNAITRLERGALDIFDRIRPTDYAAIRRQPGRLRAYDLGPGLVTDHMWFNLNERVPPSPSAPRDPIRYAWFSDVRFRRAIAHAIDRESIAAATLQGLATPLDGFVSPGNRAWAARDLPPLAYDLERSRALLREAGFIARRSQTEGAEPELYDAAGNRVEFTLIVPVESQPRVAMAAVIQEDLARLGIRMQVAPVEIGELTRRTSQSYDYHAALLGTSVTEPDPSSYTNFLRSSSPTHPWRPKQSRPATPWEARIDELLAAQARATETERRFAAFREIQLILAEQLPVIPVVARHIAAAAAVRVGNYRPSPIFPYSLWNAEELFVRP